MGGAFCCREGAGAMEHISKAKLSFFFFFFFFSVCQSSPYYQQQVNNRETDPGDVLALAKLCVPVRLVRLFCVVFVVQLGVLRKKNFSLEDIEIFTKD